MVPLPDRRPPLLTAHYPPQLSPSLPVPSTQVVEGLAGRYRTVGPLLIKVEELVAGSATGKTPRLAGCVTGLGAGMVGAQAARRGSFWGASTCQHARNCGEAASLVPPLELVA